MSDSDSDCEMCCGLRGHKRLRFALYTEMDLMAADAEREHQRLVNAFNEAMWYSIECETRHWHPPWPPTYPFSNLVLFGRRYDRKGPCEPNLSVWFHGPACDAPQLPIMILLNEVKSAETLKDDLLDRRNDVWDYAPGGEMYEEVKRGWYMR